MDIFPRLTSPIQYRLVTRAVLLALIGDMRRRADRIYRVAQKFGTLFVRLITSSNVDQFSNIFTLRIIRKFEIIVSLKILFTTPQICRYTTWWNVNVLKAAIENRTSITTNFKKLTTGNNVFIVSVIVQSNCHSCSFYIKRSIYPPCCWTTHS